MLLVCCLQGPWPNRSFQDDTRQYPIRQKAISYFAVVGVLPLLVFCRCWCYHQQPRWLLSNQQIVVGVITNNGGKNITKVKIPLLLTDNKKRAALPAALFLQNAHRNYTSFL
jgi:hypothetical protein